MREFVFVFFISLLIFSCSSSKTVLKDCDKFPFEMLDSLQRTQREINYLITKPSNWKDYNFKKGALFYEVIDGFLDENLKPYIYIESFNINNKCNFNYDINTFFNFYLKNEERYHQNFKYLKLKSHYKKYGESFIVKHKSRNINTENILTTSVFLLYYNNVGYQISYTALEEHFDRYLPDVENIVNSFKINED